MANTEKPLPFQLAQKVDEIKKQVADLTENAQMDWEPFEYAAKSTSSMPASKHFDLVFALDMHWLIIGLVPVPVPYPFFGMIFDPFDYLIGSVWVNGKPKAGTTTSVFSLAPPLTNHLGPLAMPPMAVNDGEVYFGSESVFVDGVEMSAADCQVLTCWDPPFASMPLPTNPRKGFKFPAALYNYPTSMKVIIGSGNPVMVGGAKVPHEYTLAEMGMRLAAMIGVKALGKLLKKGIKSFNSLLKNMFGKTNKLSKVRCRFGFDPVNLVTGEVVYEGVDFELAGPIPIQWERSWNAFSQCNGMLGHGVSCNYDLPLKVDVHTRQGIGLILPDGRAVGFDLLLPGENHYNRREKITLFYDGKSYQLTDHATQLTYHYEKNQTTDFEEHRVTHIQNEDGFTIRFNYDYAGKLSRLTDTVGRTIYFDHDREGRIQNAKVHYKGEIRQLVSYRYNVEGDMISITDALGKSTEIVYQNHLMVQKTDRNGQSFYWEYDTQKRCVHTWGDDGILEGFLQFEEGRTRSRNSKGESIYYFDENNLITQITDPLGNSQYFSYNEYFELIRETDAEATPVFYEYDERGNPIQTHLPNGASPTWEYNERGDVELTTDAEGGKRHYHYDENGKLCRIIKEDDTQLAFAYDENGMLSAVENEEGTCTTLSYDADYNLCKVNTADGAYTEWEYDKWGRNTKITSPHENPQAFAYDALDRVTGIRAKDTNEVQLTYNAYHEVVQAIDKQREVQFAYTPLGSLKTRTERGRKVFFRYDKDEDLTGISNERGETYAFKRDQAGQIIMEQGFDGQVKRYHRNRAGQVVRIERPENRWTEYEYDPMGNRIRAQYYDDTFEVYDYDKNGRLVAAINPHSEVYFTRDAMGQVTREAQNGHTVQSTYNKKGERTGLTSSLGADLQFAYDPLGNATEIQAKKGDEPLWKAEMQHNASGQEIKRRFSNGLTVENRYGRDGALLSQSIKNKQRTMGRKAYTWDVNHRLASIVDELKQGRCDFGHDAFGNLVHARYEDGSYDYKMPDSVGNLYKTKSRTDRKYDEGSRLIQDEAYTYQYDPEGNLIQKTDRKNNAHHWKYHWYGNGMLKEIVENDYDVVRFQYDATGRRTHKEDTKSRVLTRFVWDGHTPLHEWQYPLTQKPVSFIDELGKLAWKTKEPTPEESMVTWVFDAGTFVPTAKITAGGTYSIITDYLGTPFEAYDQQGERVWSCQLDIYGKVRKLTGERSFIPFRYQGQYEDVETGLYYNRFRYYAPDEGVYISQDPIGLEGGSPNFYAYVEDVNRFVDILGLNPIIVIGENQSSVNEAAKKIRAAGYNAESMQVPRNQWKFPKPLDSPKNVADAAEWNKGWMTDKIKQGYDVVDIGLDPYRDSDRGRSPFYAKELEALSETKGSGKRLKLKKFSDGESVGDMRARLDGCN